MANKVKKLWKKVEETAKKAGKDIEEFGRDIRDDIQSFFEREDVKLKLKKLNDDFIDVRDKVMNFFKEKSNKEDVDRNFEELKSSIDHLNSKDKFEQNYNDIMKKIAVMDSYVPVDKMESNNDDASEVSVSGELVADNSAHN